MTMRIESIKAALLLPLVLLLGAAATQTHANWFYDPDMQVRRHVGSAVTPTPKDLVMIRRGADYPIRSRMFKEEGTVSLNIWLTETGTVGAAAIERSSGFQRLDDAALLYIRENWRYRQLTNQAPTPKMVQADVTFRLD
jgi:TonB family protein